jgi:NAD(P) transhydrogenase subunit alpha
MIVGVVDETCADERRVTVVPAEIPSLTKLGIEVIVQRGAGRAAGFPDGEYEARDARLVSDRAEVLDSADLVVRLHPFAGKHGAADLEHIQAGRAVLGLLNPFGSREQVEQLARRRVTSFAFELLPRISRAQSMDALSSMATIAGYKGVLLAAAALDKLCPMMITAAGTISPARVFVVGAGVAGLQACATARRLGAVVEAYDVRAAVKEQVESLGVKFLELALETAAAEAQGGYAQAMGEDFYRQQRDLMLRVVGNSDVVIATAAVPGQRAPILLTEAMIQRMRPGSVVVDLVAESGGNCELTKPGQSIDRGGVTILGPINLPSTVPHHASQMYARNVTSFLRNLVKDKKLDYDSGDEIVRETMLTRGGQVVSGRVRKAFGIAADSDG